MARRFWFALVLALPLLCGCSFDLFGSLLDTLIPDTPRYVQKGHLEGTPKQEARARLEDKNLQRLDGYYGQKPR